jgi:hypothetical protein
MHTSEFQVTFKDVQKEKMGKDFWKKLYSYSWIYNGILSYHRYKEI